MYYNVLVSSNRFHGKNSLTYESDERLFVGQLVKVPLQNRQTLGIVESTDSKAPKSVRSIVQSLPFHVAKTTFEFIDWLSDYYPAPLGSLVELFVPPGKMPSKFVNDLKAEPGLPKSNKLPILTKSQVKAMEVLEKHPASSVLLHGDTGTGKTRLYLERTLQVISGGRSVLVLTPEIGLTQPLAEQFKEVFGMERVVITHSGLTTATRRKLWEQAATSKFPLVVIGPRSALFSPLQDVGLIVIDEAHDGAYKQEQAPHYLTSRVASQLAKLQGAQMIMGTATPLVADYWQFQQKTLPIIRMQEPAISSNFETKRHIIDLRDHSLFEKSRLIGKPLIEAIEKAIKNHQQSLLFLNRRGSARLILCSTCGWQAVCPRCDIGLTYHDDRYKVICHSCGYQTNVPTSCPECGAGELIFRVPGTKALETELAGLFPNAKIGRFDSDNRGDEQLHRQFEALKSGSLDIVIGTQTVAKGFDLPKLAVIGIIQADSGLQLPDFTAVERTYQLISQVSGRLGRGHGAGQIFIQTYSPDESLIKWATRQNYEKFYERELRERLQFGFPPFTYLLKLQTGRATSNSAKKALENFSSRLSQNSSLEIIGPAPCFIEKQNGKYVWQLVIKSTRRNVLLKVIEHLPANIRYDIDPTDLL